MDKNTIKSRINSLLFNWSRAKEELEQIKKITNPQEQYEKVDSAYREHNSNLGDANSCYSQLGGDISGTNWADSSKYSSIVNELKEIKEKSNKNFTNILNFNNCSECKKTIIGQYFQKDGEKFCSQYCFDEYCVCDNCNQKIKEITGKYYQNDSFLKKQGAKGLICEICYRGVCSECYQPNLENHFYHKEKADDKKFCSKNCFTNHYEKELVQEKKIQHHQEALVELEKLSKERKNMVNDFQQGLNDINDWNNNVDDNNTNINNNNTHIRHRERESNFTQQSQLLSQIQQLESNPTKNQSELNSKKQQLKDLQSKEKTLTKSLPLNTQISILEREIKELSNKSSKTNEEQSLLESKKQELERLLVEKNNSNTNSAKPSDKTALIISCGVVGVIIISVLAIFIWKKTRKRPVKA